MPVLRELIDASVRRLQAQDYTPAQIESALRTVFGVDSQLIADGTYLVVETIGRQARFRVRQEKACDCCLRRLEQT